MVKQTSPDSLLDTYHAERHPVAARVLRTTLAQVALRRPDDRTNALRDISPSSSAWTSRADDSPRSCLVWASITTWVTGHPLLGTTWFGPPTAA
jgi:3-(3-hydroxy-phenyl)propionate hydroxylase